MTDKSLILDSFSLIRSWEGDYKATIKLKSRYGTQELILSNQQAARVLDAAMEAMADAATQQSNLIREQVTAQLLALSSNLQTPAITAEATDAEVL